MTVADVSANRGAGDTGRAELRLHESRCTVGATRVTVTRGTRALRFRVGPRHERTRPVPVADAASERRTNRVATRPFNACFTDARGRRVDEVTGSSSGATANVSVQRDGAVVLAGVSLVIVITGAFGRRRRHRSTCSVSGARESRRRGARNVTCVPKPGLTVTAESCVATVLADRRPAFKKALSAAAAGDAARGVGRARFIAVFAEPACRARACRFG